MMRRCSLLRAAIGLVIVFGALMWPAIFNGQPFFFADTPAYIRGFDAGINKATGISTPWTQRDTDSLAADLPTTAGRDAGTSINSVKDKSVLSGRSIYYGALLYLGDRLGRFWFTVLAQAAMVGVALKLFLRNFGVPSRTQFIAVVAVIGLTTTAAFYVSFLMPDVFAAITILACASLMGQYQAASRKDRWIWFALLALSLTFHETHVLIASAMLVATLLWNWMRHSWTNWRGLAAVGLSLLLAVVAEVTFGLAVKHEIGTLPIRPPFLTARLIEDGPGYRYLRASCPGSGFKICDFMDRLPETAEGFLWATPPPGVFAPSDPQTRRVLSDEQYRFVWAVVKYDPTGVAGAAFRNAMRQLRTFNLMEFNWTTNTRFSFAERLPSQYQRAFRSSAAFQDRMPTRIPDDMEAVFFALACAFIAVVLLRSRWRMAFDGSQIRIAVLVVAGVLINAFACGILSGAHERYEARVVWLVPLTAIALMLAAINRSARSKPAGAPV